MDVVELGEWWQIRPPIEVTTRKHTYQVLSRWVKMELGALAMTPKLQHFLMSYPGYSLTGVLPVCRDAVGVFYCPCRLACSVYEF